VGLAQKKMGSALPTAIQASHCAWPWCGGQPRSRHRSATTSSARAAHGSSLTAMSCRPSNRPVAEVVAVSAW